MSQNVLNDKQNVKMRFRHKVIILSILFVSFVMFSSSLVGIGYFIASRSEINKIDKQRQVVASEGEIIADIAQKVSPSVVSILTEQKRTVNSYFGAQSITGQAAGTGVVIDSDGIILTNKHVVPEGSSSVKVVMSDGTSYENVSVLGRDPLNDIAILKVDKPKNFIGAKIGNSDNVRTGQKVIAIGNALGQFQNTVTSGIISGVGRPVEAGDLGGETETLTNLFQTDAAINSGNSGGPLLNYNGEVIGINTAIAEDAQNIGFAIPINEAKGVIASAQKNGTVSRPFLGVKFIMLTPSIAKELNVSTTSGALISTNDDAVVSGSPAQKAGLKPGDIIVKVNDTNIDTKHQLNSVIGRFSVGEKVTITYLRDGKTNQVQVELAKA